jgi:inhibitor of KinA sporulation pathway (predicted exonuclease)
MASERSRSFTETEQALVEEVLLSDGYQLILEYVRAHAARLTSALARDLTWDETLKARGELQGLSHFAPDQIRRHYQSEKP